MSTSKTQREVSLGIFLSYLKDWCRESGVPFNGHGIYDMTVSVKDDKIVNMKINGSASISIK